MSDMVANWSHIVSKEYLVLRIQTAARWVSDTSKLSCHIIISVSVSLIYHSMSHPAEVPTSHFRMGEQLIFSTVRGKACVAPHDVARTLIWILITLLVDVSLVGIESSSDVAALPSASLLTLGARVPCLVERRPGTATVDKFEPNVANHGREGRG
jgi:hypothetical protein